MKLNKTQVESILKNAPKGTDKSSVLDGLIIKGYELEGVDTATAKQRIESKQKAINVMSTPVKENTAVKDYQDDANQAFDNAGNRIVKAGEDISNTISDPNLGTGEKIVKAGSQFFKGIGQFIGGGAIDIAKTLVPQSVEDWTAGKVQNVAQAVMQTPVVKDLATWYTNLSPEERAGADNALGYAEGLSELLAVKGSGGLASKLLEIGENTAKKTANVVKTSIDDVLDAGAGMVDDVAKVAGDIIPSADNIVNSQVSKALDLTPSDIKNISMSTGNEVGEFLARNNLIGRNKEETIQSVQNFFDSKYKEIRDEIGKVQKTYSPYNVPRYVESLKAIKKQVSDVPGLEKVSVEVENLLRKAKDEITLNDVQRVKELMDDHFNLYKVTGDVKEGATKEGLANIRKEIKEFIETEVNTNTGADIKSLNNDVSTSKGTLLAIEERASKGITKKHLSVSDLGVFGIGSGLGFGNPLVGVAALAVKKILENPSIQLRFSRWLDKASDAKKAKIEKLLLEGKIPDDMAKVVDIQSAEYPNTNINNINTKNASIDKTIPRNKGKVNKADLIAGAGGAVGKTMKEEDEKEEIPSKKEELEVYKTRKDGTKEYKLESGTVVGEMHPKFQEAIKQSYKDYPELPKGIIETLLMKESTAGYDDANRNPKIGNYAWIGGLTKVAKDELIRLGYKPDFNTVSGAINSMAKFWSLKAKEGMTPTEIYNKEYSSGKLTKAQLKKFEELYNYYSSI